MQNPPVHDTIVDSEGLVKRNPLFLSLALLLGTQLALASTNFELQRIADGVYAAIVRPGSPVGSNGAVVLLPNEVLVVDTHYRPSFARELLDEIRKITPNPVRYVVNSHWHNDHTQGNQAYFNAFPRGVEFLSHNNTRRDILKTAIPSIKDSLAQLPGQIKKAEESLAGIADEAQRARTRTQIENNKAYYEELKMIEISLPTLTFDKSIVLHRGDREVQILYFGRGHTAGDVVVFLPKEKIVVTGDLLTNGIPFFRDAFPSDWGNTLKGVTGLDWDQAVPGHGPVQQGKDQIKKLTAFMEEMVGTVRKMAVAGRSLDDVKKAVDFSKYKGDFAGFTPPMGNELAIERTYLEATGKVKE